MKILQVTPCYLPGRRYGGPIASVHGLSRALVERGHEVEVFTTDMDGWEQLDPVPARNAEIDGVKVTYFPVGFGKRIHRSPDMANALHERVGEFELAHLHGMFTWPCYRAAREAELAEVPYVLSPRGMMVQDLIRRRGRSRKKLWIRAVDRQTIENAALVHNTSELEDWELRKFDFTIHRTATIPNGVHLESFDGDWATVSPEIRKLSKRRDLVLFLGRISWKKGLNRLVEAIGELDRGHLVIAGSDDGYEGTLRKQIHKLKLEAHVTFLGQVNGRDKQALFEASKMLVLPSLNENFGNVVLEAMAAAIPSVVTADVGASDLVEAAECGLVVDGDARQLADAIDELLEDSELCELMGTAGYRAAEERFSWPAIAKRFEALYTELAHKRRIAA